MFSRIVVLASRPGHYTVLRDDNFESQPDLYVASFLAQVGNVDHLFPDFRNYLLRFVIAMQVQPAQFLYRLQFTVSLSSQHLTKYNADCDDIDADVRFLTIVLCR